MSVLDPKQTLALCLLSTHCEHSITERRVSQSSIDKLAPLTRIFGKDEGT